MVYQDIFRVKERQIETRVMYCMHKRGSIKFNKSINFTNLKQFKFCFYLVKCNSQVMLMRMAIGLYTSRTP
jgi:hypothetical protein